jgi:SAM-dependent methyltransferase
MSRIAYDPVKDKFAGIIRRSARLRRFFYFILDTAFLRSWHIRRVLKKNAVQLEKKGEWKLLDAGSGFGQYDRFLLQEFPNVHIHSIDLKEDYLEDNRVFFSEEIKKDRIRFYRGDLLDFSTDVKFDFIICIDVLEHIEEDIQVMKNLSSCLKQGGYFIMHSPSHYSEEDAVEDESFVDEHARPGYSKEEIDKKLMESDLLPEKIHYTYGYWGHKAWVLSVKWPMLWFNKVGLFALIPLLFYYPFILPLSLIMNTFDLVTKNEKGNGIYAIAKKI